MNIEKNDHDLIGDFLAGDVYGFEVLTKRYLGMVLRITKSVLKNRHDAEDATQETFIKCYQALPNFLRKSNFKTWLYRIAFNTALNFYQKNKRKQSESSLDEDPEGAQNIPDRLGHSPETLLIRQHERDTVWEAIESLPVDYKTALILKEMENFSYKEIAEVMECSIGTVESRIFRARNLFKQRLDILPTGGGKG